MAARVNVDADGTMRVFLRKGEPPVEVKPDADGKAQHFMRNGVVISHDKGKITFARNMISPETGGVVAVTMEFAADGTFAMDTPDGRTEQKPPKLRRPPAINR